MARLAAFGDTKQVPVTQSSDSGSSQISQTPRPAHGSYEDHPFKDAANAQYWRDVYENAKYEGRHQFDPTYTWTAAEEKRLVRKVSSASCHSCGIAHAPIVGLKNHVVGMGNVLRTRSKPKEYQSSNLRQYAEGPQYVTSCF